MSTATPLPPLVTLGSPFHVVGKPVGPICNIDCGYCFYLEKERLYEAPRRWAMSEDVLENYIASYIAGQPVDAVTFIWQGGEPTLLGVDYFETVRALQRKHARGKQIANCLQTNGIALDDRWCEFLAREEFLVGLSIDGPPECQSKLRVDRKGAPVHEQAMAGLGRLQRHGVEFNTLTCVHRDNQDQPLVVYEFLKSIGSRYLQFIPIVERIADPPLADGTRLVAPNYRGPARVADWSVEPRAYGEFLCAIFDAWFAADIGRCFVQVFDVALESWLGLPPSLCVFRPTCGGVPALEHNGDLYSCDHFVYPEYRLGNITQTPLVQLMASAEQQAFGQDKERTLPRYCRECDVRFACNGECPKHRFAVTPDGEPGLNYLCPAYKRFFHHIDGPMRHMARLLAPSC